MVRVSAYLAIALCVLPVRAAAQRSVEAAVDQRVLITTSDRAIAGRLLAVTPDALQLLPDSAPDQLTIQRAAVRRIDISRGRAPRGAAARKGALRGAVILGSIGAVSLALQHQQVQASDGGVSGPHAAALGAFSGGLFGGAIGAAIGAARAGERWEPLWP